MKRPHPLFTLALVTLWGGGTVSAFWLLEWQYLRPVARPTGANTAHPERLPASPVSTLPTDHGEFVLSGPEPVTLINFWNPSCPCSRFMEPHVRKLGETLGLEGVRLVTIVECGPSEAECAEALQAWRGRGLKDFAVVADPGSKYARAFGVWAAPAAVILNRHGQVTYTGAYNAARYCDNRRTAWAYMALEETMKDHVPTRPASPFYGCQILSAHK